MHLPCRKKYDFLTTNFSVLDNEHLNPHYTKVNSLSQFQMIAKLLQNLQSLRYLEWTIPQPRFGAISNV